MRCGRLTLPLTLDLRAPAITHSLAEHAENAEGGAQQSNFRRSLATFSLSAEDLPDSASGPRSELTNR
jgi:hypothetical protein